MRKSKLFPFFYILTLVIFIASGSALAIRLAELQEGGRFYEQTEETKQRMSAASVRPALPEPPDVQPALPEDQAGESASAKIPELSWHFSQFAEAYPDAVFWLRLADTELDYPVMLGTDNEYYLNHLPDKRKNALGSLFLDCRTRKDSTHLIVYGHNGSGGKMFGLLKKFESQDFYMKHKTLTVAASDCVYICPIFSVRRTEADSDAYRLEFDDRNSLADYIAQAAAESLYPIDADAEAAARILTLSTCTGWRRSQRFIVQALFVPVQ